MKIFENAIICLEWNRYPYKKRKWGKLGNTFYFFGKIYLTIYHGSFNVGNFKVSYDSEWIVGYFKSERELALGLFSIIRND